MDKSDCDILVADTEHASVSATLQDQAIVRPEKSDATVQEGAVPQDGGDSEKNVLKEATCDDGKSISTIKELEVNQAINIPSSPLREVPKSSIECKEIEENSLLEQKNDVIFSSNTSVTEISPEPKSPVTSLNISKSPTASAVNDFSDILSGKLNVVTQTSDSSKVSDSANMEMKAQKPNPVESPEKKSLPVFDSTQQITKSIFSSLFSSNSQMAQASDVESSSSPTVENNKLFESKTEAQSATKAFANDTSVLDGNATCQTGDALPTATTEPVQPGDVGPIAKSQNAESDTSKEIPMVISETAGEASRAPTSEDAVVLGCIPLKIATESVPTNILYTAMTKPQVTIATVNVLSKVEVKHPPIATKGMKKENRKSLITTPPLPGGKTGKSKSNSPNSKSKKKRPPPKEDGQQDGRNDFYCWVCHREGEVLCCELCPRVFHARCLNMNKEPEGDWFCPECEKITDAECKETQSRAMSLLSIEQFSLLLKYVVQRMKLAGSEPFLEPVDTKMFPDYPDYVFHPMDLSTIEKNIRKYKYGCPEAFLTEFKWVIHNCIIYNSVQSKLTQIAKQMLKVAERELNEIEVCPECYLNSCRKRDNWFCEPCKELHPLVWAKLQGFPHWPAKALRIEKGSVDVRFFGQHDRAWIPLSGCYLISKDLPLPIKNKKKSKAVGLRGGLDGAMQEMQVYIDNIKKIIGEFEYAPPRTLLTHCDLYRKTSLTAVKTEKKDDNQDSVSSFYKNYTTQQSTEKSKTRNERKSSKDGNGDEVTAQTVISAKLDGSMEKTSKDGKIGVLSPSSSKKSKMVTTSGEHPVKSMATKKRRASMAFLTKTIESCKASLGIEKLQDVQMNSGSEDTTSSSDDDENDVDGEEKAEGADKKKEQMETEGTSTQALPEPKQNSDEDDSDAELVIDLGDIEDTVEPSTAAKEEEEEKSACTKADDKSDGIAAKKRKLETACGDKPNAPKVPLKSILVSTSKPAVASDEQKKLLVKALSEKIGNLKRKHDIDTSPSGSSPSHKSRKTNESLDSRSRSPQDPIQKLQKQSGHQKDKKKLHHVSKYPEKDSSGKRKESLGSSEKRISDSGKKLPSSIKHRSGKTETEIGSVKAGFKDPYQKTQSKKLVNSDKGGKIDKIPTGADTRKLFNGGRIPRKNPVNFSDDDTNDKDNEAKDNTMDTTQIDFQSHRKSTESTPSTKRLNGDSRKHIYDKDVNGVTFESMKKYTDRVMEGVQKVFYDMYTEMIAPMRTVVSSGTSSNAEAEAAAATALNQVSQIRLELERQKWMHDQEIAELKHNHDLTVAEIRQSLENEKKQLLLDARMQGEADRIKAIEETKKKQWCAQCGREAIFYCCWNTSYCDYPCQQKHWVQHMNSCTQAREAPDCKTPTSIKSPPTTVGHSIHSSTTSVKAIVTFSKSLSNTSTAGSKATVVLPSSLQIAKPTSTIIKSSMKNQSLPPTDSSVKATASETSTDHAEKSVQKSEKTSGLTISAIGARLLAEKQKSTDTTTLVSSSISTTDSNDHSTVTTSALVHVKTTLESPLSPDIKPASPTASLSAVDKNLEKKPVFEPISSSQCVTSTPSKVKVVLPLSSVSSAQSKVKYFTSVGNSGKLPLVDPMSASFKLLQASKAIKKQPASTILTFSSPSAVASLITEMESPLSSTLSSSPGDSSSSLANTPEKPKTTAETAKIQISQSGSAFTKVIPDSSKHTTVPDVPKMSKGDTATTQPSISKKPTTVHSSVISTTSSFKPVDTFKTITASSKESTGSETSEPVPLVKPVLADNFLTTLQKTLSKVGTSQKQVMSGTSPKLTKSSEELQGSELTPGVEKEKMETSS